MTLPIRIPNKGTMPTFAQIVDTWYIPDNTPEEAMAELKNMMKGGPYGMIIAKSSPCTWHIIFTYPVSKGPNTLLVKQFWMRMDGVSGVKGIMMVGLK